MHSCTTVESTLFTCFVFCLFVLFCFVFLFFLPVMYFTVRLLLTAAKQERHLKECFNEHRRPIINTSSYKTKRPLKERFNEHRRPIINTSSYNPTAVSRHFITGNHTVNHMLLIPLEKLYTNRDSVRKAREAFLIHRGNTLEPAGLNRRDEM